MTKVDTSLINRVPKCYVTASAKRNRKVSRKIPETDVGKILLTEENVSQGNLTRQQEMNHILNFRCIL